MIILERICTRKICKNNAIKRDSVVFFSTKDAAKLSDIRKRRRMVKTCVPSLLLAFSAAESPESDLPISQKDSILMYFKYDLSLHLV